MATSQMENIAIGCSFENVQKESCDEDSRSFERRFGFADGLLSIKHVVPCLSFLLLENRYDLVTKVGHFKEGLLKEKSKKND